MPTPSQLIGMPTNSSWSAIIDRVPKTLVSGTQSGSNLYDVYTSIATNTSIPIYPSGSLSAGVLKNILQVYGSGVINFVAFGSINGSGRIIRLRLTIDGAIVYDATSSSGANVGLVAVGVLSGNTPSSRSFSFDQIPFLRSFAIDVSTSDGASSNYIAAAYRIN